MKEHWIYQTTGAIPRKNDDSELQANLKVLLTLNASEMLLVILHYKQITFPIALYLSKPWPLVAHNNYSALWSLQKCNNHSTAPLLLKRVTSYHFKCRPYLWKTPERKHIQLWFHKLGFFKRTLGFYIPDPFLGNINTQIHWQWLYTQATQSNTEPNAAAAAMP